MTEYVILNQTNKRFMDNEEPEPTGIDEPIKFLDEEQYKESFEQEWHSVIKSHIRNRAISKEVLDSCMRWTLMKVYENIENSVRPSSTSVIDWIASNPKEIKENIGKYLAINENKILGIGNTAKEALTMAKEKHPSIKPVIMRNSNIDIF